MANVNNQNVLVPVSFDLVRVPDRKLYTGYSLGVTIDNVGDLELKISAGKRDDIEVYEVDGVPDRYVVLSASRSRLYAGIEVFDLRQNNTDPDEVFLQGDEADPVFAGGADTDEIAHRLYEIFTSRGW